MPEVRVEAEKRLLKILDSRVSTSTKSPSSSSSSSEPPEEKIHFYLGMLAMDAKNDSLAEFYFRRAISLKPDFRSALFNLALMLTSAAEREVTALVKRERENVNVGSIKEIFHPAVDAAEGLLRHHPAHVKGLILMGDLQINRMKNLSSPNTVSPAL